MSTVFVFDQVLAYTESATSEYSTTSQCLSALLGRSGRVEFIRWEKKTNEPITPYHYCLATHQPNTAAARRNSLRGRGARTTHDVRTCTLMPNKSVALSASVCQVSLHWVLSACECSRFVVYWVLSALAWLGVLCVQCTVQFKCTHCVYFLV